MQTDFFRRDVGECEIHGIDMQFDTFEEFMQRPIAIHDLPLEREIGRVKLQHMAARDLQSAA